MNLHNITVSIIMSKIISNQETHPRPHDKVVTQTRSSHKWRLSQRQVIIQTLSHRQGNHMSHKQRHTKGVTTSVIVQRPNNIKSSQINVYATRESILYRIGRYGQYLSHQSSNRYGYTSISCRFKYQTYQLCTSHTSKNRVFQPKKEINW